MKVFYWNGQKNFGDLLTPLLIKRFMHLESEHTSVQDSELVMVGSILDLLPAHWEGVIAGAGKLHERTNLGLQRANILAVRGPLTAAGLKGSPVLADPGLIANELVPLEDKQYELGIVAHWTDKSLTNDPRFIKYNPRIISVKDDPLRVISEIGRCNKIISSSLHGIVLADAFGIPRRIEIPPRALSHPHQEGGLFKWQDYSASLGMKLEVGITQKPNKNLITEKQDALFEVFEKVKKLFSKNVQEKGKT